MSLTDTKAKRLMIIVVVVVVILAATAWWRDHGRDLADHKADRVEEGARTLAARATYESAVKFSVDRLVLNGVEPGIVDDAVPGEFVVQWEVQKWGAHECITARWEQGAAPVVTRKHC